MQLEQHIRLCRAQTKIAAMRCAGMQQPCANPLPRVQPRAARGCSSQHQSTTKTAAKRCVWTQQYRACQMDPLSIEKEEHSSHMLE
eukprot:1160867-Pelagomonas_calceolata.AAC.1